MRARVSVRETSAEQRRPTAEGSGAAPGVQ